VFVLRFLFRMFLNPSLLAEAKAQAEKGIAGSMEGHAAMDMSVHGGTVLQRLFSKKGLTATSHFFVMDWVAVWKDIAGGLLIAGALSAWVSPIFWNTFFVTSHPVLTKLWSPIVGPFIAIISFVCSVGNVPLAAMLWNGGCSFGGVIAFLFADLIVLPILNIYRKYYGLKMSLFLLVTMYTAMSATAILIEFLFQAIHLVPASHKARFVEAAITWNYTTILNIVFLAIATVLIVRFLQTGGPEMLDAGADV